MASQISVFAGVAARKIIFALFNGLFKNFSNFLAIFVDTTIS